MTWLASVQLATRLLVFLATSDQHGHLERAARLGHAFAEERRQAPGRVVLLDGGDLFQGTLVSNRHEGAAMVRALNALGYAAAAIGNHEFDFGPVGPHTTPIERGEDPRGALKARVAEAHFPLLSSNIVDAEHGRPLFSPYTLVEVDGVKVGIVGGTTVDTTRTTNAKNLVGLEVRPLAPKVAEAAKRARAEGAKVVVALVHAGGRCAGNVELSDSAPGDLGRCDAGAEVFELARALAHRQDGGRVDAIFGGHTHEAVAAVVEGLPVLQSPNNAHAYSKLELEIDEGGRPTGHFVVHPPRELGAAAAVDATIAAGVASDLAEVAEEGGRRFGVELPDGLARAARAESPLGNLVADQIRQATAADVGLTNGGGLRADLPSGPLTYGALFEALPFDNRLVQLRLSAAALKRLLVRNLQSNRGLLSVSGIRVVARCEAGRLAVDLLGNDAQPIADATPLTIGTTDFLAAGGDDFGPALARVARRDMGIELRAAVAAFFSRRASTGERRIATAEWFDRLKPRLLLPGPRPVVCDARHRSENAILIAP